MANKMEIVTHLFVQFIILLSLVSCGGPVRMNIPVGQLDVAPPEQKIPLKAGLYLSQAFRSTQTPLAIGGNKFGDIYIGEALSSAAEKMMRNLFREVTVLDKHGNSQDSTAMTYDVIVTPQVELFEFRHVKVGFLTARWTTQNVITWRIVSPEGKELYQNTIRSDEIKISWFDPKHPEPIIETFKGQFQEAQKDIYANGWWRKQWWKDNN